MPHAGVCSSDSAFNFWTVFVLVSLISKLESSLAELMLL